MTLRGKHRLRWALAGLVLLAGIAAWAWWFWPEPDGDAGGEELFTTHDLGSPFATGIPYALALAAMQRYPEILGRDVEEFREKFGVLPDPDSPETLPVGFVLHRERRTETDFLMTTCALCHVAELNGQRIVGLGNRNLRSNALHQAVMRIAGDPGFTEESMTLAAEAQAQDHDLHWTARSRLATRSAIKSLKDLAAMDADRPWGKLQDLDAGPGRSTPIEFAKAVSRVLIGPPYGFVKVPAVWTYGPRSTFGCDGSLTGDRAVALSAVEFNKGMPPGDILARPERWRRLYAYIGDVQPPAYPGKIDKARANRGEALFRRHCASCHGQYPIRQKRDYTEQVVPLDTIGTDPDRLHSVSQPLIQAKLVRDLAPHVELIATKGYVASPLMGIWCRGPYLHNGSVPTLADLLRPVEERPVRFFVGADTKYDLDRLGLAYEEDSAVEGRRQAKRASPKQYLFDTTQSGNSNSGHGAGTSLSDSERRDLLEYLKTL
jgi:mono/diheme cytochrome c family protein